ncbi:hypothetical protein AAGV33_09185 [Flavobacterium sp. FBOR7N2.3]|uniref:PBCV-specific basic adaptor domain-containing protein n=1 Tax=Flavobacterium magnesitis TaxID=3138077 RepID=A0ABV4TNY7_9FLAO
MKTLKLIVAAIVLFATSTAQAQVSVNVNIGTPPAWGPSGYSNIDYYFIPDVQSYYDIRNSQFIYYGNGKWVRSRYLPRQYRNYDLYNGYKVVLNDYHGRTPYVHYKSHKAKYYKGYKGKPQKTIGYRNNDKRDYKYNDKKAQKHNSGNKNSNNGKGNKKH